jgi:singapore isolate B (sub-type 7) whole genome shotgun sequence assembly, scaffold_12
MEGFKEQQVRECLKLPKRYQIAGILSFGYEPDNTLVKPSARFPFGNRFLGGLSNRFDDF